MNNFDQKLHQQFTEYGRNAKEWMRRCILLLPEIDRRQIWKKKKFFSIHEYAGKIAGMSRTTVEEALRVLYKIADKPALQKIVEQHGLQRVRPIASIATQETQDFWAEKARSMSKNTLEMYVKNYRLETLPREESQSVKQTISFTLRPDLAKRFAKIKDRLDFETLLGKFLDSIDPPEYQEKPESIENVQRYIPVQIKNYAIWKYHGRCAYPSCTKPYTSLHHTNRFKLNHMHDPDRLVPLCTEHERIVHLGLINNEEGSPEQWRLRENPDQHDEKYYIDWLVSHHRRSG